MENLEDGDCLRPLDELADAIVGGIKSGGQGEDDHTAQHNEPQEGIDDIVEGQVEVLEGAGIGWGFLPSCISRRRHGGRLGTRRMERGEKVRVQKGRVLT